MSGPADKLCVLPMKPENEALLAKARKTNAERDKVDGGENRLPLDVALRTAIMALCVGLNRRDWETVAEGLALLQDAELRARKGQPHA